MSISDPNAVGSISKVDDGPWTIRIAADLRVVGDRYVWTATRTEPISEAMLHAIVAFAKGRYRDAPKEFGGSHVA